MELENNRKASTETNLSTLPGRLELVNEFTSELMKGFRAVDYNRSTVLTPLEIRLASENTSTPPALKRACEYFDLVGDGRTQSKESLLSLYRLTSSEPIDKRNWISKEMWADIPLVSVISGLGGALASTTVNDITRRTPFQMTRPGGLVGLGVLLGGMGVGYAVSHFVRDRQYESLRNQIGKNLPDEMLVANRRSKP